MSEKKRECGTCRLCCKVLSVDEKGVRDGQPYEFHKRPDVWCPHSTAQGCAIHESPEYPRACKVFRCAWLAGMGQEDDRPDKIRAVPCVEFSEESPPALIFYESWPGSFSETRRGNQLMRAAYDSMGAVGLIPSPKHRRKFWWRGKSGQLHKHELCPSVEQFTVADLTVDTDERTFQEILAEIEKGTDIGAAGLKFETPEDKR